MQRAVFHAVAQAVFLLALIILGKFNAVAFCAPDGHAAGDPVYLDLADIRYGDLSGRGSSGKLRIHGAERGIRRGGLVICNIVDAFLRRHLACAAVFQCRIGGCNRCGRLRICLLKAVTQQNAHKRAAQDHNDYGP